MNRERHRREISPDDNIELGLKKRAEISIDEIIDETKKFFESVGIKVKDEDIKDSIAIFNPDIFSLSENVCKANGPSNNTKIEKSDDNKVHSNNSYLSRKEMDVSEKHQFVAKNEPPLNGGKGHYGHETIETVIINGKSFSQEKYQEMVKRRKNGESIAEISRDVDVDRKGLNDKFRQQNIRLEAKKEPKSRLIGRIRFGEEEVNKIIERRKNGETIKKIALDLGINENILKQFFFRRRIVPEVNADIIRIGRREFTEIEINLMIDRRKNGEAIETIAKDNQIKRTTLLRFFNSKETLPTVKATRKHHTPRKKTEISRQDVINGRFSPEVREKIDEMRRNGKTIKEISQAFNIEQHNLGKYFIKFDSDDSKKDLVQIGEDWIPQETANKMIESRKNGDSIADIARKNNVRGYSLGRFLQNLNIKPLLKKTSIIIGKKKLAKEKVEEISEKRRNGASVEELASELEVDVKSLYNYFNRNKVHMAEKNQREINRKYAINHDFFERIDSYKKAYLLGLIMTDGNIHKQHNSLRLDFQKRDKELCEIARNSLSSGVPIHERADSRGRPQVYVQFNSKTLCSDLEHLGIERGTKIYHNTFPVESMVPRQFQRDVIRGLWDGDGSVIKYVKKSKNSTYIRYSVCLTGTRELLTEVQKIFIRDLNLNETKILYDKRTTNTCNLFYTGTRNVSRIFEFLYPAGFNPEDNCLRRKYNLMREAWEKYQAVNANLIQ
ncbi:MAG TPA: hypothetical protein VKM55_05115 [Candidatus Lokiarchaeia archaeon]|nr:hypothetical protein [Candidatus Lokiarchaeia archaeon]